MATKENCERKNEKGFEKKNESARKTSRGRERPCWVWIISAPQCWADTGFLQMIYHIVAALGFGVCSYSHPCINHDCDFEITAAVDFES